MAITRIKNNQITDSTIFANTKIAAGTIVGSLFNSNLTMSSDVTITGNLTVQGSSTYTTIASTNTYVNDPMIVLNNAFSGTNTYDIGLVFNRGSDTSTAIHWDETADEFVLTYTTEDGTTYGDINTTSYANVKMGNVTVEYDLGVRTVTASGNVDVTNGITVAGDIAANGGDITTDETTFNLINDTATTLNIGGAATTLELGAASGTTSVNNDLDVDGDVNVDGGDLTTNQTTFNLLDTNATTVNAFGAATTLELGAATGTLTVHNAVLDADGNVNIDGGALTTNGTDFDLLNTNATTVNFAGAATTLELGATTGTTSVNNALDVDANVNIDGGALTTNQTEFDLLDTNATTINFGGGASAIEIGAATSNVTIADGLVVTDNLWGVNGYFTTLDSTGATSLGLTDATAINSTPIGNATPSTGAFTTLSATGSTTVEDIAVNGGDITTDETTFNLVNTTATTVNFAGAATDLTMGSTSGNTTIQTAEVQIDGNLTIDGSLAISALDGTPIGATTPDTGAFTTLDSTGATSLGLTDATAINSTPIGNATPSTGAFTTLDSTGATSLNLTEAVAINNTPIGNATPSTGDFTTLSTTGEATLASATVQDLSDNRVTFAGTGGILEDSDDLTFDGTDLAVGASDGSNVKVGVDGTVTATGTIEGATLTDGTASLASGNLTSAVNVTATGTVEGGTLTDGTASLTSGALSSATTGDFSGNVDAGNFVTTGVVDTATLETSGEATLASAIISDLTSGRVVLAGTSGAVEDDINLTYSTDVLTVANIDIDGTPGAVTISTGIDDDLILSPGGTGLVDFDGTNATNLADPVSGSDAVTLTYLETALSSDVTNIGADDSIIQVVDDGISNGYIYVEVDASEIANLNATTTSLYSDTLFLDDGANVAVSNGADLYVGADAAIWGTTDATSTTTGALTVAGGVGIEGNLWVGGDLHVANLIAQNDITLTIQDPLLYLTANVTYPYNYDIGFHSQWTGGVGNIYQHGGFVRDADDEKWKLFSNVVPEIGSTVDFTNAKFDTLVIGNLEITTQTALVTTQTTADVFNTTATTVNAFGAATTLELGAATGNTSVNNSLVVDNTLWAQGANYLGLIQATAINNTPIGNATPSTGDFTNLSATGTTTVEDIAVNGGDITTDETTFNLVNTTATTLNIGGAATTLELGATTGTTSVNNALDVDANVNVDGGALTTNQTDFDLLNTNATTINFAGAGTDVTIGATTGTTTIQNAEVQIDGNLTIDGSLAISALDGTPIGATTPDTGAFTTLDSTGATSLNLTEAVALNNTPIGNATPSTGAFTTLDSTGATSLNLTEAVALNNTPIGNATPSTGVFTTLDSTGATSLNLTEAVALNNTPIGNATPSTGAFTTLDSTGATSLNLTEAVAINNTPIGNATPSTGAFTTLDSTGDTSLGLTDATAINSTPIGNATPSTGAFTNLSATGTTVVEDLAVNGGDITTDETTFNLVNDTATTVNFAGAATTLELGASTGTTSVNNNLDVDGDVNVDGGDLTTNQTTFNLVNANATTLNLGGDASTMTIGATSGTATFRANVTVNEDLLIQGGDLTTDQTTFNLLNDTATTVNFAGAATTLELGASSGTTSVNNDLTVDGTLDVTGVTNLNDTTDSTSSTTGALIVDGGVGVAQDINVGGRANVTGITNINSTATSTQYDEGALIVDGGVGVAGNLHVQDGSKIEIGAELSGNIPAGSPLSVTTSANLNSITLIQNISTASDAHTQLSIANDDYNGDVLAPTGSLHLGINGSGFADSAFLDKAGDSVIYSSPLSDDTGGNLFIGTSNLTNQIVFTPDFAETIAVMRGTPLQLDVVANTAAVSTTTGALTVFGGVGINSNLWVGNGAVINSDNTSDDFTVKGLYTDTLIYADSSLGAVVIGGGNTSVDGGTTLKVNSTDSMMIPVGSTAERPSNTGNVDVTGMLRFNTTVGALEFYDGSEWAQGGSDTTFTIVTSEQFNGNGVQTTFTLAANAATAGAIVSVNGIVQLPVTAYDITGDQLEFTEAPESGDVIDVRKITTTSTIDSFSSANGFNSFIANANGIYGTTGESAATERFAISTDGIITLHNDAKFAVAHDTTNIASASTDYEIDSFSASDYSSAKYVVQAKEGSGNVEVMEALVVHDSSDAYITTYGIINTGNDIGSLSANVVSGNVKLYFTSDSITNANVRVHTTYIQ